MDNEDLQKEYEQLTEKQKRFIDYYIELGNAKESAIKAGYSKKTAKQIGSENLSKLDYIIKSRLEGIESKRIATADEVLEYLTKVMRGEERDQFDLDATLQDRTKAAELLGKRYRLFTDKEIKLNSSGDITIEIDYGDEEEADDEE